MFRWSPALVLCVACVEVDTAALDARVSTIDTGAPSVDTGWRPKVDVQQPRWAASPRPRPIPQRPEPAAMVRLDDHARGDTRVLHVPRVPDRPWELGLCIAASPAQTVSLDCSGLEITVEAGFPAGGTVWTPGEGPVPQTLECTGGAWLGNTRACGHWLDLR